MRWNQTLMSLVAVAALARSSAAGTAGSIEGAVVGPGGAVMPRGTRVTIRCGAVQKVVALDGTGAFSASGLPEGTCTLSATAPGMAPVSIVVQVAAGSIASLLVTLAPPLPPPEPMFEEAAGMGDAPPPPVAAAPMPAPPPPPAPARREPARPKPAVAKGGRVAAKEAFDDGAKDKKIEAGPRMDRGRFRARRAVAQDQQDRIAVDGWAPVRVFPAPQYTRAYDGPRTDFRETIYWNPTVTTNQAGVAEVTFYTSDAVTAFRATAEGFSSSGVPGAGQVAVASKLPLALDVHLPVEVTAGDTIELPVTIANTTDEVLDADLTMAFGAAFRVDAAQLARKVRVAGGSKTSITVPLTVVDARAANAGAVKLAVRTRGLADELDKTIRVVPRGFPFEVSAAGTARTGTLAREELDLTGALPGSIAATLSMYPSPVASMAQGLEGMIREPSGCFEQTSSSNYPNIMILSYLSSTDAADPALIAKTQGVLDSGYKKLVGFETKERGYEWFGGAPGHEALTAYGLMEFADMAKVYDVDRPMMERTANWLLARRDGHGGFGRNSRALDSFGRASDATTNAYIMWALAEAGRAQPLATELAAQRTLGESTQDPYLLALAANTAARVKSPAAPAMLRRLAAKQAKDGSFPGAKETITMSGGESLVVETTALALLALLKDPAYGVNVRAAAEWLEGHRSGYGAWSNTQATVLGLKALTAYAEAARQMQSGGSATLIVNGKRLQTIAFEKGRKDALVWNDFASALVAGKNVIEVELDGAQGMNLPYTIGVSHRSDRPQSSQRAKIALETKLLATAVKGGEGVTLRAHVANTTQAGVPMTLARVGIPGGLVFQTWQLKELRDKGLIDFYETRPREVILYWRSLAPGATKDVDLALLAAVPGTYEAPASSAYLYYTAEDKTWTAPARITVR